MVGETCNILYWFILPIYKNQTFPNVYAESLKYFECNASRSNYGIFKGIRYRKPKWTISPQLTRSLNPNTKLFSLYYNVIILVSFLCLVWILKYYELIFNILVSTIYLFTKRPYIFCRYYNFTGTHCADNSREINRYRYLSTFGIM